MMNRIVFGEYFIRFVIIPLKISTFRCTSDKRDSPSRCRQPLIEFTHYAIASMYSYFICLPAVTMQTFDPAEIA